jgi:hypothetical protein
MYEKSLKFSLLASLAVSIQFGALLVFQSSGLPEVPVTPSSSSNNHLSILSKFSPLPSPPFFY